MKKQHPKTDDVDRLVNPLKNCVSSCLNSNWERCSFEEDPLDIWYTYRMGVLTVSIERFQNGWVGYVYNNQNVDIKIKKQKTIKKCLSLIIKEVGLILNNAIMDLKGMVNY
jgi:hypothetical protein